MSFAIIDDVIELDGMPVARLLPHLRPTLLDRLVEALEQADEDAARIWWLEMQLGEREASLHLVKEESSS
jgi:hypothetical protein